jgi:hypothetical protein
LAHWHSVADYSAGLAARRTELNENICGAKSGGLWPPFFVERSGALFLSLS